MGSALVAELQAADRLDGRGYTLHGRCTRRRLESFANDKNPCTAGCSYVRSSSLRPRSLLIPSPTTSPIPIRPEATSTATSSRLRATRERLLDAAEDLFAERGFEATPMRALARAARTSLSSTHYHFGTKEALLEAVLRRRAEPLNALRLARLDALERESAGVSVAALAEAIVRPLFEVRAARATADAPPDWRGARLFYDRAPIVAQLRQELLGEVDARFIAALARALPHRTSHEIEIAYRLTNGLLAHFAAGRVSTMHCDPSSDAAENDAIKRGLLAYAVAGLRALEANEEAR